MNGEDYPQSKELKRYTVRGGYTVYEQYEIQVEAVGETEAQKEALKIPVEKWDELQSQNSDCGFTIDDVWEDEE